jgi:abortive infection bacteriophage resistance protein
MHGDQNEIEEYLRRVSYYRLSGYTHPFRKIDPENGLRQDEFVPGTRFREVAERYRFDEELRAIVFKKISLFEISLRTALAHEHSVRHGPFGYVEDPTCMPGLSVEKHAAVLAAVQRERSRSSTEFVKHFDAKYGDEHWYMPVWMAAELMSFGTVLTWYRNSHPAIRQSVATGFRIHDNILVSWIRAVHALRNICAHHARLWNRILGARPVIPKDSAWHKPVQIKNDRVFSVLTILAYLSADKSELDTWRSELEGLLQQHATIPIDRMGFPADWTRCPIWSERHD